MSLVCQKMFATRDQCVGRNLRIQSVPVFFSAIHTRQHVREAKQWFIHKLHRGAGPLKFLHSPSSGQPEMWTSGRGLCVATLKPAFPSDCLPRSRSAGSGTGSRLDAHKFCVLKYSLNRSRSRSVNPPGSRLNRADHLFRIVGFHYAPMNDSEILGHRG
jgi:hypothetical protein